MILFLRRNKSSSVDAMNVHESEIVVVSCPEKLLAEEIPMSKIIHA